MPASPGQRCGCKHRDALTWLNFTLVQTSAVSPHVTLTRGAEAMSWAHSHVITPEVMSGMQAPELSDAGSIWDRSLTRHCSLDTAGSGRGEAQIRPGAP